MPGTGVLTPNLTGRILFSDLAVKNIRVSPWKGAPKTPPPWPPALGNLVQVTVANLGNAEAPASTTLLILVTADSVKRVGTLPTGKISAKGECQTSLYGFDLREQGVLIVLADAPIKGYPLGQVFEQFLSEGNNVFAVPYTPSQEEQVFNNVSIPSSGRV